MKVIDLLNMIVNKEDLPKKVKYDGKVYEYVKDKIPFFTYLRAGSGEPETIMYAYMNSSDFNREVEIVDEEIDIQNIKELSRYTCTEDYDYRDMDINRQTINELIMAIKQLDNKLKEK